jgi:hypothetical protein
VSLPHRFVEINKTEKVPDDGNVAVAVFPLIGVPLLIIH